MSRGQRAEALLARAIADAGWRIDHQRHGKANSGPDLLIRKGRLSYVVELKAAANGRGDQLIPLWSQAWLQVARAAGKNRRALAVVVAPRFAARAADHLMSFAALNVPDAAVGVIDATGLRRFRGKGLDGMDADHPRQEGQSERQQHKATKLFSDLNQWMLKVLLAAAVPARLMASARDHYRNATELARAANVSLMSAFRFIEQLRREGFLDEASSRLRLVRVEALFDRWRASVAAEPVREQPMRFVLRSNVRDELKRLQDAEPACLALFAAADHLKLGFVNGVPPHVYVRKLRDDNSPGRRNLMPTARGEAPDIILRQPSAPESVFRAMTHDDRMFSCDAIQIWLDVAGHPLRGDEQAELIRRKVIDGIIRQSERDE